MSKMKLLVGERYGSESVRATVACNDYLRMGPSRSQAGLIRQYKSIAEHTDESPSAVVPTLKLQSLRHWSSDFGWASRAEVYDASFEQSKTDAAAAVMGVGLSLAHNRITALKKLASKLEEDLESRLWTKDFKSISKNDYVELLKLNTGLLKEYRGLLDDLARETGGRVKGIEVAGVNGGPIELDLGTATRNALFGRLLQDAPSGSEEASSEGADE